ncbi:MAG: hypothetical protein IPM96_20490 [Ignavibacteria bacterium]|nr:hypothetical protein [Ignavibacteria bacterium]
MFKNLYFENFYYKKATNILSDVSYGYMNLYLIGLDSFIIKKDYLNNVTALASKEYIEDTNSVSGYLGQIKNEKLISTSDTGTFIKTEFEYYKNDTTGKFIYGIEFYPNKNGNIKLVKKPNNQIEKYFYHLVTTSEMWPDDIDNISQSDQPLRHKFKIKYNNGTVNVLVHRKMEFLKFDLGRSYCFSGFNSVFSCLS